MKTMFNRAGNSIKKIVKAVTAIQIIISVVLGITGWAVISGNRGSGGFFVALLIIAIGCFSAWLSGLLLYAYGDIADNVELIREAITENTVPTAPAAPAAAAEMKAATGEIKTPVQTVSGEKWKCASCGYINAPDKNYCVNCNVTKVWSQRQWEK